MNPKLLPITLAILTLNILPAQASCPTSADNPLEYQRRNNNRCEGIKRASVSGAFGLISFASHNINNYRNTLSLQVPSIDNIPPNVRVHSRHKRYILDNFTPLLNKSWFIFNWSTAILKQAGIPPSSLRAIATLPGSQPLYVPVILGQPSDQYEFVFFTANRTKFKTFQILYQGREVYSKPRPNPLKGEVKFTWKGSQAKKGRYQLRVVVEIQQRSQPPETVTRLIQFEHNPNWLK